MLYCVSLLEKPIKKGELQGKCVFDYTDKPFLHFMLFFFFHLMGTLLDSELRLDLKSTSSAAEFSFSHENKRVCVCMHAFAIKRATNTHN